jgi:hypothetical protein
VRPLNYYYIETMEYPSSSVNARQIANGSAPPARDPDEINLLEYIYVLVKHKKRIAGLTLLGLVLGFIAALIKGPTWVAEAVIAPKEIESQKRTVPTGLSALGGLVASQFDFFGSASLDKMDLILDSRDFGAKLIEKYDLLPFIYKYKWPKVYKKYWDPSQNAWKPAFKKPKPLDMGSFVKKEYLKKIRDNKKNTLLLSIRSGDSAFSINLAEKYVEYLNEYIKSDIQRAAKGNVAYLDTQLVSVVDPLLRTKILGLIADEIEKEMVVSNEAFKTIDPVYIYKKSKEKKVYPLFLGFGLFFMSCLIIVFMQAFASSEKTKEDKLLIDNIKREIFSNRKR